MALAGRGSGGFDALAPSPGHPITMYIIGPRPQSFNNMFQSNKVMKTHSQIRRTDKFIELFRQFNSLCYDSSFPNVEAYANKFQELNYEMSAMDVIISEPFLIVRFLHGLGPAFTLFETVFLQTHDIIKDEYSKREVVTLHKTINLAIDDELWRRSQIAFAPEEVPLPMLRKGLKSLRLPLDGRESDYEGQAPEHVFADRPIKRVFHPEINLLLR